ncbi:hypothetical protein, partial [Akkermansia sp.]|uniref:hypothetical protein n=1 Tax=Akkermansia sp. TaxID=1872421 RepID=UPI003FD7C5A7
MMDVPASKRKLYKGMNISYLSNRMKPLLPLLLIALFPGLCAAAKTAEPAMPERLEKREAATRITYQGG